MPLLRLQKHRKLLLSLLMTTIVTAAVSTPAAFFLWPHAFRWKMLALLNHPDAARRETGLQYVLLFAPTDRRVRDGAIARLPAADARHFLQIAAALDQAGAWDRKFVPDESWLRWLSILTSNPDPRSRVLGLQFLADLPSHADNPQIQNILDKTIRDDDKDVRYNALTTAVQLRTIARAPNSLARIVHTAAADSHPGIARHACIWLGLMAPSSTPPIDPLSADPAVAQAMLWSALHTHPDHPQPALQIISNPSADPSTRAFAAYALHPSRSPQAAQALIQIIQNSPADLIAPDNQLLVWRALLAAPTQSNHSSTPPQLRQAIRDWLQNAANKSIATHPAVWPLVLAAGYTTQNPISLSFPPTDTPETIQQMQYLMQLALLEGSSRQISNNLPPNPPLTNEAPELLRLAALAASNNPNPDDFHPLFISREPATRDLACLIASQRLNKNQLDKLIATLLGADPQDRLHFFDSAKMSGAILSGLTSLQTDLLKNKSQAEDNPLVRHVMRLGLWMQNQLQQSSDEQMDAILQSLLAKPDSPKSTLLLGLLHKHRWSAIDYLFNPRGEPRIDLIHLLDERRWWLVLQHYLAENAPQFWVWADPELEQFQIDVLRDWCLLNRHKPSSAFRSHQQQTAGENQTPHHP